jgi:hypothetical protein
VGERDGQRICGGEPDRKRTRDGKRTRPMASTAASGCAGCERDCKRARAVELDGERIRGGERDRNRTRGVANVTAAGEHDGERGRKRASSTASESAQWRAQLQPGAPSERDGKWASATASESAATSATASGLATASESAVASATATEGDGKRASARQANLRWRARSQVDSRRQRTRPMASTTARGCAWLRA